MHALIFSFTVARVSLMGHKKQQVLSLEMLLPEPNDFHFR